MRAAGNHYCEKSSPVWTTRTGRRGVALPSKNIRDIHLFGACAAAGRGAEPAPPPQVEAVKAALDRSDSAAALSAADSLRLATSGTPAVVWACDAFESRLACGSLASAARTLDGLSAQFSSLRSLVARLAQLPAARRPAALDALRDDPLWGLVGGLAACADASQQGWCSDARRRAAAAASNAKFSRMRGSASSGNVERYAGGSWRESPRASEPRSSVFGGLSRWRVGSSPSALVQDGASLSPRD